MSRPVPIERALSDRSLLGAALGDQSTWAVWFSVLRAAYGRPLRGEARAAFARVAGGRQPPKRKIRELVVCASRRAGKGRIGAALAVFEAALVDHSAVLAPGETGVVACISPTRAQAAILLGYARGYLETSPLLRDEIAEVTADEIRLRNGNIISVLASDYRTLRGRTLLFALLDEASFLRDDSSATPDIEAARALLPGLMTTGGTLAIMSSPYRRVGLLHQRVRDFLGKDDPDVLVVTGASTDFNPTLDSRQIEAARLADPQAAAAEWFGQFRNDLAQFLDDALVDGAIDSQRPMELMPRGDLNYVGFCDLSGGRHDASTLVIGHAEGDGADRRYIADVIRGFRAPHDPATAVRDFASLAKQYRITQVFGDNYSADWVSGAFTDSGLDYQRSALSRSELYIEGLPLFARGLVRIPDHPMLTRELRLLERRTTRSGKDSVDHGTAGSDDYANSLFGVLHRLSAKSAADGWIAYAAGQAERAQQEAQAQVDDDDDRDRGRFYLPGNPRANEPPSAPPAQASPPAAKTHPSMPEALRDNPVSRAYYNAIGTFENRPAAMATPRCAHCGEVTAGSRLTDGTSSWCHEGCRARWAIAKAEKNRAREIAINGGLPPRHGGAA